MSIVLSYRALRDVPLSPDEAAAIDIVIARYQSDFEYRDAADAFTVHPTDPTAPEVIFHHLRTPQTTPSPSAIGRAA